MKKLSLLLVGILVYIILPAQSPLGFSYQAVLRDSEGKILPNQSATLRISLTNIDGTISHFTETHSVASTVQGLVNIIIGNGQNQVGTFTSVPWNSQAIYIGVDIKLEGQLEFTVLGRQKLQSVPYALFAADGNPGPQGDQGIPGQDGVSLIWKGELTTPPSDPQTNWAYYNKSLKGSYVYNGTEWDTLAVDGKNGIDGSSGIDGVDGLPGKDGLNGLAIKWLGSFATPPTPDTLNQAYHNIQDSTSYIWDGFNWQILTQKGAVGPQGEKGETGSTGADGLPGNNGIDGISIEWLGELSGQPSSATKNQAYYNKSLKVSFVYDGLEWDTLSVDGLHGISLEWLGTMASAPLNPTINQAYYNSADKVSYVFDGNIWQILSIDGANGLSIEWLPSSDVEPTPTKINQAYYNTVDKKSYIWNGSLWEIISQDGIDGSNGSPGISVQWLGSSNLHPTPAYTNNAYYNSSQKVSFIYNGSGWDTLAKDGSSIIWKGEFAAELPSPALNWAYYNTTNKQSYVYDGTEWKTLAKDGVQGLQGLPGVAGPKGEKGDPGTGLKNKGAWSADSSYVSGDYVFAESASTPGVNSMWICQAAVGPIANQPKSDATSWVEFEAPQGDKGDTGEQGIQGIQGEPGKSILWKGTFASAPSSPELNWAYYNSTIQKSYVWDGDSWEQIVQDGSNGSNGVSIQWLGSYSSAPLSPSLNQAYYNSNDKKSYVFNGSTWEMISQDGAAGTNGSNGISITWAGTFASAPSPVLNKAYYNSTQNKAFVYDGDSWEILSQDGSDGTNGTSVTWLGEFPSAPISPSLNNAYYNSTLYQSFIWDGDSWEIISKDGATGAQGPQGEQGPIGPQGPEGPIVSGTSGQTLRHNGTSWIANSILFNDGTNVGIGTNVPNQTLSIRNDAGVPFSLHKYSATTGDDVGMLFKVYNTTSNLYHKGGIFFERTGAYGNGSMHFATTNAALTTNVGKSDAKMTITGAGNVGIGTTSPSQLLDVNGTTRLRGFLYDYNNSNGTSGQVLTRGVSGIEWQTPAGNISGSGVSGKVAYWSGTSTLSSLSNITYVNSLEVKGEATTDPDAPIFEVKNSAGEVIFGVYQEGVRINIKDAAITKGVKGGFAVGGLTNQTKAGPVEYFRITPDSARIYVKEEAAAKGVKGGFAVGGLTNQTKAIVKRDLLFIAPDSARIYVDTLSSSKGVKGGFAVGGLTNQTKATANSFFQLSQSNYFIGYEAGKSISTGRYNSFFGHQAGMLTQTGRENIFIGYQSGLNNTSGNWNTFLGYKAGLTNTGSDNTFIGFLAGSSHLNEGGNVYIGSKAGRDATHGKQNVYIGESSGLKTTYGNSNVFIGFESGMNNTGDVVLPDKGSYNVYLGYQAGKSGNLVFRNVFLGYQAGMNTYAGVDNEGSVNVFIGSEAGLTNTIGYANTAIGEQALKSNTTGYGNIALGRRPLISNTTGIFNIAVGNTALYYNQTGKGNVAVGSGALGSVTSSDHSVAVGEGALVLSLDSANVAVGPYALGYLRYGINNTAIGKKANVSVFMGTYNNTTAIGYGATVTESNQIVIGNNEVTKFNVYGAYAATTTSAPNMYVSSTGQIMRSTSTFTSSSGTASKIAFWSDATTLTSNSNLHWDNTNGRLGLGVSSPASVLHINQSTGSLPIRVTKATTSNYWGFGVRVTGTDNDDLVFAYNGTTKGYIDDVDGSWDQASDARLKSDIEPLGLVLDKVIMLKPTKFYFKANPKANRKTLGFIAQDVELLFPDMVNNFTEDDGVSYKGLSYDDFAVLSIQSIIELNTKLENTVKYQEETINSLKKEVDDLKAKVEEILKAVSK